MTTTAACQWTASSPDSWIGVPAGQRTGSGTIQASIAANGGAARSGRIAVGSASLTVTQDAAPPAPCTFKLAASQNPVPASGGDFRLDVGTSAGCKWQASSSDEWIGISSGGMAGSASIPFVVRPNTGDPRSGRIAVGDTTITIAQAGCVTDVSPANQDLPSGTSSGKLAVSAIGNCLWTVRAPSWIVGLPASGAGSSAVAFRVEANTGPARTGTIEIGGRKVQVRQAGGIGTVSPRE